MSDDPRLRDHASMPSSAPEGSLPGVIYAATCGPDVIDTGLSLDALVGRLRGGQRLLNQHVVVWVSGPGDGPRAVALLRPGGDGATTVTWL